MIDIPTSRHSIEMPLPKKQDHHWLSSKEASRLLGVSYGALRNMVYKRQIPFYKLGRRLRFRTSELNELVEKRRFEVGRF